MKKTLIIGVAAMLLLSASTASAHGNEREKSDDKERGNNRVTLSATSTAQITSIKQQIEDLNKQLKELRRTSRASAQTIHREEVLENNSAKTCSQFAKKHGHWKWRGHGHRGWWKALDQNFPEYCKNLPGYGSSTTPVVDTTAPAISGITITPISTTTATVSWTTNEGAASKLFLSTSSPVLTTGTPIWTDAATTSSHGVQLVSLIPGTTYYFVIQNTDAANNTATSAQGSFVTASLLDTVAPTISGISIGSLANTAATISWTTNENASSKVYLSTSSPVSTSSAVWVNANLLSAHSAPLTGLATGTTYYFVIEARDPSLNVTYSVQGSFNTTNVVIDTVAPIISALTAAPTGSTTATVAWTTNESADSTVYYASTSPVTTASPLFVTGASLVSGHSVNLSSLTASTTYYLIVSSKDAANNLATSSQTSFTTSN